MNGRTSEANKRSPFNTIQSIIRQVSNVHLSLLMRMLLDLRFAPFDSEKRHPLVRKISCLCVGERVEAARAACKPFDVDEGRSEEGEYDAENVLGDNLVGH